MGVFEGMWGLGVCPSEPLRLSGAFWVALGLCLCCVGCVWASSHLLGWVSTFGLLGCSWGGVGCLWGYLLGVVRWGGLSVWGDTHSLALWGGVIGSPPCCDSPLGGVSHRGGWGGGLRVTEPRFFCPFYTPRMPGGARNQKI